MSDSRRVPWQVTALVLPNVFGAPCLRSLRSPYPAQSRLGENVYWCVLRPMNIPMRPTVGANETKCATQRGVRAVLQLRSTVVQEYFGRKNAIIPPVVARVSSDKKAVRSVNTQHMCNEAALRCYGRRTDTSNKAISRGCALPPCPTQTLPSPMFISWVTDVLSGVFKNHHHTPSVSKPKIRQLSDRSEYVERCYYRTKRVDNIHRQCVIYCLANSVCMYTVLRATQQMLGIYFR